MSASVAVVAVVAASLLWPARQLPGVRLRRLLARPDDDQPATPGSAVRPALLLAAAAGLGAMLVIGAPRWAPLVAAPPIALALGRRSRAGGGDDGLALVLDLVAACLSAGATTPDAWQAAAAAATGPLNRRIGTVVTSLRSGAAPADAWSAWLDDPGLSAVARTCIRTADSGAAAAAEVARAAARLRGRRRAESQQRAARASVWVVLPLGLCFLPAFVLVGVVPIAVGLLHGLR